MKLWGEGLGKGQGSPGIMVGAPVTSQAYSQELKSWCDRGGYQMDLSVDCGLWIGRLRKEVQELSPA